MEEVMGSEPAGQHIRGDEGEKRRGVWGCPGLTDHTQKDINIELRESSMISFHKWPDFHCCLCKIAKRNATMDQTRHSKKLNFSPKI